MTDETDPAEPDATDEAPLPKPPRKPFNRWSEDDLRDLAHERPEEINPYDLTDIEVLAFSEAGVNVWRLHGDDE
jgi:hypothetical protein